MSNKNEDLVCYKTLSVWTSQTIPEGFKSRHNTRSGTWAKLVILSGSLIMEFMSDEGEVIDRLEYSKENQPPLIQPKQYHRIVSCSEDVRCQLSFYAKESVEN
ncbi:SAM-dependent methylase [Commensalibacter communis]|uniref:DUF1971 domain-containing protein n=1 Tax=Commensalibacter communis TaxID=2972786 RepID=UPI0022FF5953|nr:DUF1971 domain-containing protein [Commensalibacter communis]CAI3943140.1 SAM-dependent methylase [Commensalibacter communis]